MIRITFSMSKKGEEKDICNALQKIEIECKNLLETKSFTFIDSNNIIFNVYSKITPFSICFKEEEGNLWVSKTRINTPTLIVTENYLQIIPIIDLFIKHNFSVKVNDETSFFYHRNICKLEYFLLKIENLTDPRDLLVSCS